MVGTRVKIKSDMFGYGVGIITSYQESYYKSNIERSQFAHGHYFHNPQNGATVLYTEGFEYCPPEVAAPEVWVPLREIEVIE